MMGAILAGVPAFVVGVVVGLSLGVLLMAALFVAKRADDLRPGGD